ncbi:MAG TPA: autolysin [Candidatus Levilactobacillus faecigallinarum]|uniref:Autolysin n=1 Tax=Candidatus Levilactobacillus faecigallinarum TaxID=2838638 RepID=A0A9D1QQ81_9LACO|nr:autolysin [Candidatus Levilactobacillus faecigallinarum]
MTRNVVDIAVYQSDSLAYLKSLRAHGAKSLMVKLTEGTTYLNAKASNQITRGLKIFETVGVYHYFQGRGTAEAAYFLAWVKKFGLDKSTVLAIDVEDPSLVYNPTAQVNAFLKYLIKHGYTHVIVYGPGSWFGSRIHRGVLVDKHIWPAAYQVSQPGVADANAWQYTDNWKGLHVDGSLDFDGSLSGIGTHKTNTKPKKATYLQSAKQVKARTSITRYRDKTFRKPVDKFPKGQIFDVKHVIRYGKITRLKLSNGLYITSNTNYVKRIK